MLTRLTIHELGARFRSGEATPSQAAREYLDRITSFDPKVKAYLTRTSEAALGRSPRDSVPGGWWRPVMAGSAAWT